jgi:hypothetical protein
MAAISSRDRDEPDGSVMWPSGHRHVSDRGEPSRRFMNLLVMRFK